MTDLTHWKTDDFIYAYYKIRPEEFNSETIHKILQINYNGIIRPHKLRKLFLKLINPIDNYCTACYIKSDNKFCNVCCNVKEKPIKEYKEIPTKLCRNCNIVPIKVFGYCKLCNRYVLPESIICDKCNQLHFKFYEYCNICKKCCSDHKHCLDCNEIIDKYNNCACL